MYKIIYEIIYKDATGRIDMIPDYLLGFQTVNPSNFSTQEKEEMGKMSFETKNPQYKALSVKVVLEKHI